jgi:tight adherence protein C
MTHRQPTQPPPLAPPILTSEDAGWAARLGRPFVAPLHALGFPRGTLIGDLAVIGRPVSTHLAQQASCALVGFLAPVTAQLLLTLSGLSLGITPPVLAALVLAVLGFLILIPSLRDPAIDRRGLPHPPRGPAPTPSPAPPVTLRAAHERVVYERGMSDRQ